MIHPAVEDRFTPEPNTGCWLWTGAISDTGYGLAWSGGRVRGAHRLVLEYVSPNGSGMACHRCDNRACVNPDHLFWGSNQENALDSCRKGRFVPHRRKLSNGDVVAIRESSDSTLALASKYGIDVSTVRRVRGRETHRWLT